MNKTYVANSVLCLIIFAALVYGLTYVAQAPDAIALINPKPKVSEMVEHYAEKIVLQKAVISTNQVTHETRALFSVDNHAEHAVRNLIIVCELTDGEGNSWGRQKWVVYGSIEPGAQGDFEIADRRYLSHHVKLEKSDCFLKDFKLLGEKSVASSGH